MPLFPDPPGVKLRRCRTGQRVQLVKLTGGPRGEPTWAVQPVVLIVGRFSAETVLLHSEEAWGRSRAAKAACPVAHEVDKDTRCVPL